MAQIHLNSSTHTVNAAGGNNFYYLDGNKTITTSGQSEDGLWVKGTAENRHFIISGDITATGNGAVIGDYATGKGAASTFIVNASGSVVGRTGLYIHADDQAIGNFGLIKGTTSEAIYSEAHGLKVANTGIISSADVAIRAPGEGFSLVNSGTVSGEIGVVGWADGAHITNTGTIAGESTAMSFAVGDSSVVVDNRGAIKGHVQLGANADTFTNEGGTVAGEVRGGKGNDTYNVDSTALKLVELSGEGDDTVNAYVSYTLKANFENLYLAVKDDPINGTGNAGKNFIYGNGTSNVIKGLGGNDYLEGGQGNDKLYGGDQDDTLVEDESGIQLLDGGSGRDLVLADKDHAVTANLRTGEMSTGDKLVSIENFKGSGFSDKIYGSDAGNHLWGMLGDDRLVGGKGNDTLEGGVGHDTFIFKTGYAADKIVDFETDNDHLDIRDWKAVTSLSDLKSHHAHQVGNDVVISAGSDVLTLKDHALSDLDHMNILF